MCIDTPTILIVDDEEHVRIFLNKTLENKYKIVSATCGSEALAELEKHKIEIVITDLKMPIMSGMELIEHIRRKYPEIGIIIITGHGEIDSFVDGVNMGVFEYIFKPFNIDLLFKIISSLQDKMKEQGMAQSTS